MSMSTDSLAVSKPVSRTCLEKFQNLRRAFGVTDLSSCGGSFNCLLDSGQGQEGGNLKAAVKDSGVEEFCHFVIVAPQSRLNRFSQSFH